MRNISIFLFLILVGCKDESKNKSEIGTENQSEMTTEIENEIDQSVSEMWNNFIQSNPEFKNDGIPESDFFHNNEKDANRLAELTLTGKKRASSGLYSLYQQYNADLPSVGTKQIVTDFNGNAKAIIENVSVDTIPFNKISKEYAELDMGTDIEPLEKWKKAHWEFFENFLKESGQKPTEEMLIVAVEFEKIWPKNE
ncbi:ASCH domain-containing protein [Winogradskyella immobilis]|uniref:ASCH domain-containing protein n=1 Tax=Winogradskyella immobilis TaxID=2816852 RepID=A0ABS8ERI5_9FLAO|nr:ASCH domain-containing protein [Winogradskyella immobilis]MCC1485631.1 ASCH domain-containing protein [Winogradskyella immobilis]MCG0017723.1 ASCH domain-containing protein [Winogradskyella immobilis]